MSFLFVTGKILKKGFAVAKVLRIEESQVKQVNNKTVQRVIFSDDKIIYVDIDTGEVKPDSTPDKYVDMISSYNIHHTMQFDTAKSDNDYDKSSRIRRVAANIDLIFVILITILGIIFLMNGGFFIIILLWTLPMTLAAYNIVDSEQEHVALGVCHILFFNIVSGILILMSNSYVNNPFNNGRM